jgi:hypothetical protein
VTASTVHVRVELVYRCERSKRDHAESRRLGRQVQLHGIHIIVETQLFLRLTTVLILPCTLSDIFNMMFAAQSCEAHRTALQLFSLDGERCGGREAEYANACKTRMAFMHAGYASIAV